MYSICMIIDYIYPCIYIHYIIWNYWRNKSIFSLMGWFYDFRKRTPSSSSSSSDDDLIIRAKRREEEEKKAELEKQRLK